MYIHIRDYDMITESPCEISDEITSSLLLNIIVLKDKAIKFKFCMRSKSASFFANTFINHI